MLIQLLIHQPGAIGSILNQTPTWVWALLAGLIALGASQLFRRQVSVPRTLLLPITMTALSVYGLITALGNAGLAAKALALWAVVAVVITLLSLAWRSAPPPGSQFDATRRRFDLPGSTVPLALILAIFFTKYGVGVELAMQPQLAHDSAFVFGLAAIYGAFNGLLIARTARLWRLVNRTSPAPTTAAA